MEALTPGGAGIVLSLCAYFIFSVVYWKDRGIETPAPFRLILDESNLSVSRVVDVVLSYRAYNYASSVPTPVHSSHGAGRNISNTANCHWKVQFWGHRKLKLTLKDGDYYCPETNCTVEFIKKTGYDVMKSSHVILLHHRGNWVAEKVDRLRSPEQIIAYWTRETPAHSRQQPPSFGTFFNWTVTYSSRSEVPIPYGSLVKTEQTEQHPPEKNWAEGKTGLAIWISSNCKGTAWERTKFVKKLREMVKVDTFGRCGDQSCGSRCLQKVKSYKFYIALENAHCEDYITEKMWRNAFQYDAVPVVYGPPRSDYERLAPKNSFIHISDFANVSSLATYLRFLDKDDAAYNSFFDWRREYSVEQFNEDNILKKESLCSISRQLTDLKAPRNATISNAKWFKGSCRGTPVPKMV